MLRMIGDEPRLGANGCTSIHCEETAQSRYAHLGIKHAGRASCNVIPPAGGGARPCCHVPPRPAPPRPAPPRPAPSQGQRRRASNGPALRRRRWRAPAGRASREAREHVRTGAGPAFQTAPCTRAGAPGARAVRPAMWSHRIAMCQPGAGRMRAAGWSCAEGRQAAGSVRGSVCGQAPAGLRA